jgi:hypothetical protein
MKNFFVIRKTLLRGKMAVNVGCRRNAAAGRNDPTASFLLAARTQ